MNASELKIGSKVVMNGWEGTVTQVCGRDSGLLEIRFPGGIACIDRNTFDGRHRECYIVRI